VAAVTAVTVSVAQAEPISIDWVTVGDPGNVADIHGDGYGAVAYEYRIGKCEVSIGQYVTFLNAVAASDPHGLYDPMMSGSYGGIARGGVDGSYTYSAKPNMANRPVNFIDFEDGLRFANWLHNGQQGAGTTEDGAYDMSQGTAVTRQAGAKVFLPTEDEWYKAAFYKGGSTDAGYWDYATGSDAVPDNNAPASDTGNSANYFTDHYTEGSPYYTTEIGAFSASGSAYGTFDQAGNLWEWNETIIAGATRVLRGGSYNSESPSLVASAPRDPFPEGPRTGFRLASTALQNVPEPSTIALLAGLLCCWLAVKRRRSTGNSGARRC
jgi:formylglycine-generating enzyme required for sulfatase activity